MPSWGITVRSVIIDRAWERLAFDLGACRTRPIRPAKSTTKAECGSLVPWPPIPKPTLGYAWRAAKVLKRRRRARQWSSVTVNKSSARTAISLALPQTSSNSDCTTMWMEHGSPGRLEAETAYLWWKGRSIGPTCGAPALSAAKCSAESPGRIQRGKSTLARNLSARRSRQGMFPSRANSKRWSSVATSVGNGRMPKNFGWIFLMLHLRWKPLSCKYRFCGSRFFGSMWTSFTHSLGKSSLSFDFVILTQCMMIGLATCWFYLICQLYSSQLDILKIGLTLLLAIKNIGKKLKWTNISLKYIMNILALLH